jgi:lipoprotein-anchoring transpeptidase ErfK/SrfK
MVDYFPVLNRAVEALDPDTQEARRALYDRARRAMIDGLRNSDPTLSDTDLKTQTLALEAAIRRVEAAALQRAAQPRPGQAIEQPPPTPAYRPPPPAVSEDEAPPEEDYGDRPPLEDSRKPLRLIAAAAGVFAVLIAGVAAYTFWPGSSATPPSQRSVAAKRGDPDAAGAAPYVYLRQPVYFRSNHPAGTIVVDKQQNFLYVVRPSLSALRYGIGVGPDCTTAAGLYQIVRKEEWPGLKGRQASDEERSKNPLGARALYLSSEPSRIHGTNSPSTIGRPAPLGCIRLSNDDVIHLYERSPLETRVVVLN